VFIKRLRLQNFRCFGEQEYSFSDRFVVIEGKNGAGKSSILEALHYACYLRSFRTHASRDLIKIEKDYFFIEIDLDHDSVSDQIYVGFDNSQGRVVKFNQKPIVSYRDLILQYRTVSLCADDIIAVSGEPEYRRDFLNHSLLLLDPGRYSMFKKYKQIIEQRKSLLLQVKQIRWKGGDFDDQVMIWSEKLWELSVEIKRLRIEYLEALEKNVNNLLAEYFCVTEPELQVKFKYISKNIGSEGHFEDFWPAFYEKHHGSEVEQGRSFFGAHIDDFLIEFFGKKAKIYASRGQQKLIIFLMKISQLDFMKSVGKPGVLLLDDFLTDFDKQNIKFGLDLLMSKDFQVFLTNPNSDCILNSKNLTIVHI
jgi:DNA replication and repair protein RecF